MTTKQLVQKLYLQMIHDLDCSTEQLELIVQLYQSYETIDERNQRIAKFNRMIDNINKV